MGGTHPYNVNCAVQQSAAGREDPVSLPDPAGQQGGGAGMQTDRVAMVRPTN